MTDTRPLVSIIVPVYNAEKYLPYCVDSILAQSYRTLEIILIDDGATDKSPQICDSYAALDSRVHVIHQENGGIAKAQNAGLDAAHGEYIAFVDNDDILDRHNIEFLLHALLTSDADMSKARWQQFGVSQLSEVKSVAAVGTTAPDTVTAFKNPLQSYQTVFCKSLRLIGDMFKKNTEARYFNEANWCRLYKRELWDGIRFPEGMYAQDVMVSGELYSRMHKVVDIDCTLYYWLQSPGSVTHSKRNYGFYQDNLTAGLANFEHALGQKVLPARSYYTMVGSLNEAASAPDLSSNRNAYEHSKTEVQSLIKKLSLSQKIICVILRHIRLAEKAVYDRKIKNMR